jgi:hypothetical protein
MEKDTLRMQFLSGVITEGEYKAIINKEIEDAEKSSLNESMIGGIVGIGAINQIPPRAKADYETAFEHFLGGKYGLNEVEIEEVEELEEELEEGKEEVVLSNEILNFLEERGIIDPSDAQKVHTDLTAFLNKLSKNPTPDRIRSKSDYIAGIEENEEESN